MSRLIVSGFGVHGSGGIISLLMLLSLLLTGHAADLPLPPVVTLTIPVSGAEQVDPDLKEIRVSFSAVMKDSSGAPTAQPGLELPADMQEGTFQPSGRTWVVPVKLQPGRSYGFWINGGNDRSFKSASDIAAIPYLVTFSTRKLNVAQENWLALLSAEQRRFLDWTERQFRNFFDSRSYENMAESELKDLVGRLLQATKGPVNREYYAAINTFAVLPSPEGLAELRRIAFDRAEKDNRDRWMAIRALGLRGDKSSVPQLIHLVYHGNVNTRWWAQLSLVRLTGRNFEGEWEAWGKWWNSTGQEPKYDSKIIRWWNGQAESDQLAQSLLEADQKFFQRLR